MPVARTAMKVAPVAVEIARQLDRQLRPHVLAYRFARDVDGFVGRWTSGEGGHWVVFARRDADMLRAFPPLPPGETDVLERELDRSALRHHGEMPEAKLGSATSKLTSRALPTRNRHHVDTDPIDVEVIDIDRDDPPR